MRNVDFVTLAPKIIDLEKYTNNEKYNIIINKNKIKYIKLKRDTDRKKTWRQ